MRLSPIFILPLLFTTWQTAFSATIDDCSKITTDAERLACFDSVSKQNETSANTEAKSDEQKSGWDFYTEKSKMDDSISYTIKLTTDNRINGGGNDEKYGVIFIDCSKIAMSIAFYAGGIVDEYDGISRVRYRLDKEQAKIMDMTTIKPNYIVGLWNEEKSVPFIKEMFGHDKMLVEVSRYGRTSAEMEFSIKGLEEAIKPVRKACNW